MKTMASAACILALIASPAFAQESDRSDTRRWSLDDLALRFPEITPILFLRIDEDGDGMVSQAELDAAIASGLLAKDDD